MSARVLTDILNATLLIMKAFDLGVDLDPLIPSCSTITPKLMNRFMKDTSTMQPRPCKDGTTIILISYLNMPAHACDIDMQAMCKLSTCVEVNSRPF